MIVRRHINMIEMHFSAGSFFVSWNSRRLLEKIGWSSLQKNPAFDPLVSPVPPPEWLPEFYSKFRNYFLTGEPFDTLPWEIIDQSGWTEFQHEVYRAAALIPHGETRTYGWIARSIGKSKSARAVGQALKKNPIPILVPCHRVVPGIAFRQKHEEPVGGFMGQSDESSAEVLLKRNLLALENQYCNPVFSFFQTTFQSQPGASLLQ